MNVGNILLVEDDPADADIVRHFCKRLGVSNPIHSAHDGQQAVDYLAGQGEFTYRQKYPFPALVLLDIGIPKWDGFDVLSFIRREYPKSRIPVVMLTASDSPMHREKFLSLGANAFLSKTSSCEAFAAMLMNLNASVLAPFYPEAVIQFANGNPPS